MPPTPTLLKTKQITVTTTVGTPGVHTQIPTEKAVRAAIAGLGLVVENHNQIIWTIEGANLTVALQGVKAARIRLPYVGAGATIEEVYIQLGTTPGAANIRIDIHKNGATIHTVTAYVEVAVGDTATSRTTNFDGGGAIAKDDYFQIELVQGDATAADLVAHMRYKWTLTDV